MGDRGGEGGVVFEEGFAAFVGGEECSCFLREGGISCFLFWKEKRGPGKHGVQDGIVASTTLPMPW